MKRFQSSRRDLLEDLRQCLEHRFEDTTQDIIQATKLLNFQKYWPTKENMKDFGDSELHTLVTHFSQTLQSAGVEVEKIQDEWEMLKSAIYNQKDWLPFLQSATTMDMSRQYHDDCPNLLSLFDLLLTLPSSTAECERGFNAMKQI